MNLKFDFNSIEQSKKDKFKTLTELLVQENSKYNLTRITEPSQIQVRHYEDSLVPMEIFADFEKNAQSAPNLIDIGSGAGFPSLALAIMLENWKITSIDSTGKKIKFQQLAAEKLGLGNFTAIHARAEELGHDLKFRSNFDFVTARAVSHYAIIAELCVPFLKIGGRFLAWKGPKATEELSQSQQILAKIGSNEPQILNYSLSCPDAPANQFVILSSQKLKNTPIIYPRAFGQIKKSIAQMSG